MEFSLVTGRTVYSATDMILNWRRGFLLLLLALFCAPLVLHIYLGSYSRFIADDFCSSAAARSQGLLRGAVYWYMIWTGRFSANLLDNVFGYLGPAATPYVTGLVIIIWFVVLAVAVVQLLSSSERPEIRILLGCVIAAMILFAVLEAIPSIGQSLYWGQGMRSVVPPLILGTTFVGLISNRSASATVKLGRVSLVTAALFTFIAAGFAETYFAVQTSAIVFALVIPFVSQRYASSNRRSYFMLLVAGLLGSLTGGLVMFIAPGNRLRQGAFPPPPGPPELLSISFRGLREFFQLVVFSTSGRFVWSGLILCAFVLGFRIFRKDERLASMPRGDVWTLVWMPFVAFVLLLACWIPMAWGTSLTLAYRTMIIPTYVLMCLVFCWAYVLGRVCDGIFNLSIRRTRVFAIALSLIAQLAFGLFAAASSRNMWKHRSTFVGYARAWDERDAMIRSARSQGMRYAVVRQLHNWANLDEIAVDPKITWLTKCVDDYYA